MDNRTIVQGRSRYNAGITVAVLDPEVAWDDIVAPTPRMVNPKAMNDSTQEVMSVQGRLTISF